MTLTVKQARDEMLDIVRKAYMAHGLRDNQLHWWDAPNPTPEDSTDLAPESWVRTTVRHESSTQRGLGLQNAKRCFERRGTLTIENFSPFGSGLSIGDDLYMVGLNALEGRETVSGIWFLNVRLNEIGHDGAWFKSNVLADFIYDEVK